MITATRQGRSHRIPIRRRGGSTPPLSLSAVAALAVAFLLLPASSAFGEVIVNLDGSGTGTVTSLQTGTGGRQIECSNVGGGSLGPHCGEEFPFEPFVELAAAPGGGSYLAGWTGKDPFGFGTTCDSGTENPCTVLDLGEFAFPPVSVTATFELLPDPPVVTTGDVSEGVTEYLRALSGTVDPGGTEVESCSFEYGTTTEYGTTSPCVEPGAAEIDKNAPAPVAVHASTEPLEPSTEYHYRLVASNLGGSSKGEDRTFVTGPAPSGECNGERRREQGVAATVLPPCMALELVSPQEKGSQPANQPQVSQDGERVIFRTAAALAGTGGALNPAGDLFVSSRGASGWGDVSPTVPPAGMSRGWAATGEATSFTPDFSSWIKAASTPAQEAVGVTQIFNGGLGGAFAAASPQVAPLRNPVPSDVGQADFRGASADHSHIYFTPGRSDEEEASAAYRAAYLPGDPEPEGPGAAGNTYVARTSSGGAPSLELLARDREGKVWGGQCGASLGNDDRRKGRRNQGAVSADGSRVYFSTRPSQPSGTPCESASKLRILERRETSQGPWIGPLFSSECSRISPPCPGTGTGSLLGPATGRGNITLGSQELTNVTTNSGAFVAGQTITGTGIPAGTTITAVGSGTLMLSAAATSTEPSGSLAAGSKRVTNVHTTAGAFVAGMRIIAPGIPANATIASVPSPGELELSEDATAGGSGVALAADDGDDFYEGASTDGTKIYFTTSRTLANSDRDVGSPECNAEAGAAGCDLYLYDSDREVGHRLVQVSAGGPGDPSPGKNATVLRGVTAISPDGSHVYFVARGVLTNDKNSSNEEAVLGQPNLYVWDETTEATSFIGTLVNADGPLLHGGGNALWGQEGTFRDEAYPVPVRGPDGGAGDGHTLLFQSKASLLPEDTDGGFRDVYRYDSVSERLELISKAAPGGNGGAFDVVAQGRPPNQSFAPGTDVAEQNRWVSEDGDTIIFVTAEPLLPGDVNGRPDAYLWRDGQLYRLPGTGGTGEEHFEQNVLTTMSASGSEIAFATFLPLLPRDKNTAKDVYVARLDGGFVEPESPPACSPLAENACQPAAGVVPGAPKVAGPPANAGNVRAHKSCAKAAKKAQKLSRMGAQLRRRAAHINDPKQARRLRHLVARVTRHAGRVHRSAAHCRNANRRNSK